MTSMLKVLYLTPWYPHRYDAMLGLFVRKHAEAVARRCGVCVLCLFADEKVRRYEVVDQVTNGVRELYVYYPFSKIPVLRQLTKAFGFLRAFMKGYALVEERFGRPDVTQTNVLTRCGVLSYWLKKRFGIPYVVVEHWTRYLPSKNEYRGFLRKRVSELVVRNASCVLPVSEHLSNVMRQQGLESDHYRVVRNVVDDFFYDAKKEPLILQGRFRFLHISCFSESAKNVCGILRAVKRLSEKRTDFSMTMVGVGPDYEMVRNYAKELCLPDGLVSFLGELPPDEVCRRFTETDAFVLFSNAENAPVVISEALATGTPVISTNVGGIPEMVDDESGCLINPGDEEALRDKMDWMIDHPADYDAERLREKARCYGYDEVGRFLVSCYEEAVRTGR